MQTISSGIATRIPLCLKQTVRHKHIPIATAYNMRYFVLLFLIQNLPMHVYNTIQTMQNDASFSGAIARQLKFGLIRMYIKHTIASFLLVIS